MAKRSPLAREEIGLLMSFANAPEAFTQEAIGRLEAGLTSEEMLDFFARAGLSRRVAASLIEPEPGEGADLPWAQRSLSYRRATIATIAIPGLASIAFSIGGGDSLWRVVQWAALVGGLGWLVYKVIVVISPR